MGRWEFQLAPGRRRIWRETVRPASGSSGTFTADNTAPTIGISGPSASLTIGRPVTYLVTYADVDFNSSTLSPADISLNTTGTASAVVGVSGRGTGRVVTLSGISGNGTIGISIAPGTATDLAGNTAPAAGPSATFIVDNTAPTVVSVSRLNPLASVVNATSLTYQVVFSEAVTGVTAGAFQLNLTGTATGTIASVSSGSGTAVTVVVNGVSGDGMLRLDVKGAGTGITDMAGNPISGGFSAGDIYTIDNTVPLASIGGPSLSITRGGPVTFAVTYTDANFGSSTLAAGNITLNRTGSANASVGVSGSGDLVVGDALRHHRGWRTRDFHRSRNGSGRGRKQRAGGRAEREFHGGQYSANHQPGGALGLVDHRRAGDLHSDLFGFEFQYQHAGSGRHHAKQHWDGQCSGGNQRDWIGEAGDTFGNQRRWDAGNLDRCRNGNGCGW